MEYVTRSTTSWGGNANMVFKLKWDMRIQLMACIADPVLAFRRTQGFSSPICHPQGSV